MCQALASLWGTYYLLFQFFKKTEVWSILFKVTELKYEGYEAYAFYLSCVINFFLLNKGLMLTQHFLVSEVLVSITS